MRDGLDVANKEMILRVRMILYFLWFVVLGLGYTTVWAQTSGSSQVEDYPLLRIGGFSDVIFYANDSSSGVSNSGFKEGQLVLHYTSVLSPRMNFFGEVTMTPASDRFKIEVERTMLKFNWSDRLKLSLGRYHTPITWWNTAFHHGLWLQTTIRRPEMTQFGSKFIPVHFVGALAQGSVSSGGLNFFYEAGLGNGRADIISRSGDAGDANNHRAWVAHVFVRPDQYYPLRVGGAVYRDKVSPSVGSDFTETIASAYVLWTKETPEFLSEVVFVNHKDRATRNSFESKAYYIQVAYRLPWLEYRIKPYARFEEMDISDTDPVFVSVVPDLRRYTAGVRTELSSLAAVKAEYRRERSGQSSYVNSFYSQVSFAF